jgi:Zn-dependent oligopeptidase
MPSPHAEALRLAWDTVESLAALRELTEQQATLADDDSTGWDAVAAERKTLMDLLSTAWDTLSPFIAAPPAGDWQRVVAEIQRECDKIITQDLSTQAALASRRAALEETLALVRSRHKRYNALSRRLNGASRAKPPR